MGSFNNRDKVEPFDLTKIMIDEEKLDEGSDDKKIIDGFKKSVAGLDQDIVDRLVVTLTKELKKKKK